MINRFALSALALFAVAGAQAGVLFQTDFDAGYTLNTELHTNAAWDAAGDNSFVISNSRAHSGTQSVFVDMNSASWVGSTTAGGRWNWSDFTYDSAATSNKIVSTDVWVYIAAVTGDSTIGLDAYDAAVNRLGSVLLDATDGSSYLIDGSDTIAAGTAVANLNAWNHLNLTFNFSTLVVSAQLNGVDIGVSGAMDPTLTTLNDVDLYAAKNPGSTSQGLYFDDYSVQSSPVPEPASMTGLSLGALALLRRRRRS